MLNKDKKPLDIVIVNNNYEKMARKKQIILQNNELAVKTNEKIEASKRLRSWFGLIVSLLIASILCVFIWFNVKVELLGLSEIVTKLILFAVVILCSFTIGENTSAIAKRKLESGRKNVVAVDESINFVTSLKGKKAIDINITSYEKTPYETQLVRFDLTLEDDKGRLSQYNCLDKWKLTLLPMLFDVIIDAENMSIYLPFEDAGDNEKIRDKIKSQINEEQIGIEREAREKVEKELSFVKTEKEAVERLLLKNTTMVGELKGSLNEAEEKLGTIDAEYSEKIRNIQKTADSLLTEKENLLTALDLQEKKCDELSNSLSLAVAEKEKYEEDLKKAEDILSNEKGLKENALKVIDSLNVQLTEAKAEKEKALSVNAEALQNKSKTDAALEAERTQKEKALSSLSSHQKLIEELKAKLAEAENKAKAAEVTVNSFGSQQESEVVRLKGLRENDLKQFELKINALKKQHEEMIGSLKEKFTDAAKEAKDALEKKHADEVKELQDRIATLSESTNTAELMKELEDTKASLKKETVTRTARDKELEFERDKIRTLESKLAEGEAKAKERVNEVLAEKEKLEEEVKRATEMREKAERAKATSDAAAGVQERALLKEKEALVAKIKLYEDQLKGMESFDAIKEENKALREKVSSLRNEETEKVKEDCEERIKLMKEENEKMEKKMREALESAAKEKAERIKGEQIVKQYLSDKEKAEYEKKMAERDAEIAKAKEMAEKAQKDAMKGAIGEEKKEPKRPPRHLIY